MNRVRSPGVKLFMAGAVAVALIIPLMMVYWLVYDREEQSRSAQQSITSGWGGAQQVTGPVLVIPYEKTETELVTQDGKRSQRTTRTRQSLFVSPQRQSVKTNIDPSRKAYAIYESVVYDSTLSGTAVFALPDDLSRYGVTREQLILAEAELRFGVSDPRGLKDDAKVTVGGEAAELRPGNGPAATGGSGFSTFVAWDGAEDLTVEWTYGLRGSRSLALVPRGGETEWQVTSPWPHPSFTGSFLPDEQSISGEGFTATYSGITNLALGRPLVSLTDHGAPVSEVDARSIVDIETKIATIGLVDPVDLYSQVDRATKYGFLFIGFTFAAFLLFDVVGGARVSAVEYLLTGAGLILFFVMLLAFAEVIGFGWAYLVAAGAIVGLLTAYSAAVLGGRKRAGFIGAMLAGLYALLYVLLSMETYSLLIGSLLLFAALAGIMYATRGVDWSGGRQEEGGEAAIA
ncbi:cell envelope integrity protein CreD [Paraurantiacibacter namhicola]|uniref:Inner membrane protein CreD n=1 Tax=Paraurantiacibacter namhicola TaxID=645517 RepID=A0A1C7D8P0_9SPHN|nr:cell envelope integrity protein CreD [Paraurantiacibacter namhicola]ANU07818.1 Inner membrane protein CreD [Paraurantiacibacter namhicola]